MASGEDFKASNLSVHRSSKGVSWDATALVIERKHQAADNRAAELECTSTDTTHSKIPEEKIMKSEQNNCMHTKYYKGKNFLHILLSMLYNSINSNTYITYRKFYLHLINDLKINQPIIIN